MFHGLAEQAINRIAVRLAGVALVIAGQILLTRTPKALPTLIQTPD